MDDKDFAGELRKWWSFNSGQQHTHSWHDREDFIAKKLPELLNRIRAEAAARELRLAAQYPDIDGYVTARGLELRAAELEKQ